jgi:hypothetical protein
MAAMASGADCFSFAKRVLKLATFIGYPILPKDRMAGRPLLKRALGI